MSAESDLAKQILAIIGSSADDPVNYWAAIMISELPAPDRLALARAMVADMPGVMCGVVPERLLVEPSGGDLNRLYSARVAGFNVAIDAMLANKEPTS